MIEVDKYLHELSCLLMNDAFSLPQNNYKLKSWQLVNVQIPEQLDMDVTQ